MFNYKKITPTRNTNGFNALTVISDHIVVVSDNNESNPGLEVWNFSNETPEKRYRLNFDSAHKKPVTSLAVSPDGKLMVSGAADGKMRLWDISTAHAPRIIGYFYSNWCHSSAHCKWITSLSFSEDGKMLASGSSDGVAKLWNITNPITPRLVKQLTCHLNDSSGSLLFCPENTNQLYMQVRNNIKTDRKLKVCLISIDAPERPLCEKPIDGFFAQMRLNADGRQFTLLHTSPSGASEPYFDVYERSDMQNTQMAAGDKLLRLHGGKLVNSNTMCSFSLSPDGRLCLASTNKNDIFIFDTTKEPLSGIPCGKLPDYKAKVGSEELYSSATAWTKNGDGFYLCTRDGWLSYWVYASAARVNASAATLLIN